MYRVTDRARHVGQMIACLLCGVVFTTAVESATIQLPTTNVILGASVSVPLTINSGTEVLGAYDLTVSFTTNVLQFVSVTGGNGEFSTTPDLVAVLGPGQIRYVHTQQSSTNSPTGTALVSRINFSAVGTVGSSSALSISEAHVYNRFGIDMALTAIQNGHVNLGASPPLASFTGVPTNGRAPLGVTFTDTSTGAITNRFWNFGDGQTTNTLATSTLHTYEVAGSNTVTLIVRGPGGVSTNIKPGYITVVVYPPGDVNGDFHVTGSDSLLINQVLVGLRSNTHPVFAVSGFANGNANQTNAVNGADSLLINQVLVNLRAYATTKILPGRHARTAPTAVTVYGVGFPTNSIPVVTIGSPVNLTLTNILVLSREQISALVPAGGGLGTGTVNVVYSSTNGVISFGRFMNE